MILLGTVLLLTAGGAFVIAKFIPKLMLAISLILIFSYIFYPYLDPYVEPFFVPPRPHVLDDSIRVFPLECFSIGVPSLLGVILRRFFPKL